MSADTILVKPLESAPEPLHPSRFNQSLSATSKSHSTPKAAQNVSQAENHPPDAVTFSIPTVSLECDVVSADMAACLANSLLEHVLFLKNQVPFPVIQLNRMSRVQEETRNSRKRVELLSTMDTLSSHLNTTFTALSNALAPGHRSKTRGATKSCDALDPGNAYTQVYLTFVVGTSPGASKANVVMMVDGLESSTAEQESKKDAPRCPSPPEEDDSDSDGEVSDEDDHHLQDEDDVAGASDGGSEPEVPPSSPSPSPSPPPSTPPSPQTRPSRRHSTPLTAIAQGRTEPLGPTTSQRSTPKSMPPPDQSFAQRQQTLRAAERLLSRTLASANAEGAGLSAELAATHTHVYLRAPRRFEHPAWRPRQNFTRALDSTLQTFLNDAVRHPDENTPPRKKGLRGAKTDGVRITCRSGSAEDVRVNLEAGTSVDEADEMIWWEWDGKIVGFSEW